MEQMDDDKIEELSKILKQIARYSESMELHARGLIFKLRVEGDLESIERICGSIRSQLCEISVRLHQIDEVSGWNEQWKNNY